MFWKCSLYCEEKRRLDEKMLQIATSRPSLIRHDDKCISKISSAICDYGRNKVILIKWEERRRPKYNAR
jgi:hypothetical protein